MPETPERPVGSFWTVDQVEAGMVLVLVGPFAATPDLPEYVVAPVYSGLEPGFRQTDEDVALAPEETGLATTVYVAIWNTRPALARDLLLQRGHLPDDAIREVRDAYWCTLTERPMRGPRLGRAVRSRRDAVIAFQAAELERWRPLSSRVFQAGEDYRALRAATPVPVLAEVHFERAVFTGASLAALLQADPRTVDEDLGRVASAVYVGSFGAIVAESSMFSATVAIEDAALRVALATAAGQPVGAVVAVTAANADYALAA